MGWYKVKAINNYNQYVIGDERVDNARSYADTIIAEQSFNNSNN
jgi:hypothetical protein